MMSIDFECGHVVENVGMPGMAIRAHIGKCENKKCQSELPELAVQYQNVEAP